LVMIGLRLQNLTRILWFSVLAWISPLRAFLGRFLGANDHQME
jgi:hypothetical protein